MRTPSCFASPPCCAILLLNCRGISQVDKLRAELRGLEAKITEAETLLRFADPDGYYRTGTRAAAEARSRGLRQHALDRQRAQEEVCQQGKHDVISFQFFSFHFILRRFGSADRILIALKFDSLILFEA